MEPFGERLGDPSAQTVATKPSLLLSTMAFMSAVNMRCLLMCSSRLTFIPRVYEAELIAMLAARGRACGGVISSVVEQAPLQRRARSDAACVPIPARPPLSREGHAAAPRPRRPTRQCH